MNFNPRIRLLNLMYDTPVESLARKVYMYLFQRKNYEIDRQTVAVMHKILTPASNCIDIGCYRGEILRYKVQLSPRGEIFGFEPVPYHYDFLKKKFPRAKIFQVALGQAEGMAKFYFDPEYPGRSRLAAGEGAVRHNTLQELKVRVDKLDNMIPTDLAVDFIKIDVQEILALQLKPSL